MQRTQTIATLCSEKVNKLKFDQILLAKQECVSTMENIWSFNKRSTCLGF